MLPAAGFVATLCGMTAKPAEGYDEPVINLQTRRREAVQMKNTSRIMSFCRSIKPDSSRIHYEYEIA